ncbi:uncharacterized protein BT62DRAFT_1001716 [Guyanagaster necrorhizus]|uniref:Uncharacterized protein n=1 Tax=Guyanagaster necrorhizus TaxID=856835 RepID=A0A9P7W070_9AGAR|nr:uncharacterized protein BT62DRAFT_1001716 [Guyanagaster necrorhizus MCA 3950]KAG7450871.1 hypothetical protein BT62DRAFT_1001716 [Guyanagaster necrorhizus MCA 3950]
MSGDVSVLLGHITNYRMLVETPTLSQGPLAYRNLAQHSGHPQSLPAPRSVMMKTSHLPQSRIRRQRQRHVTGFTDTEKLHRKNTVPLTSEDIGPSECSRKTTPSRPAPEIPTSPLCYKEDEYLPFPAAEIHSSLSPSPLAKLSASNIEEPLLQTPGGNPNKRQRTSGRSNAPPPPEDEENRESRRKTNLAHLLPMPCEFPDPRATANLPTAGDEFPYDKFTRSGETPATLPAGSATPFTDPIYPRKISAKPLPPPLKSSSAIPFGAGPKFYAENRKADLLLKTFLEGLDFPDKGKLTVFFPIEAKEDKKAWAITAFQGNVVSNDPDLIPEALACIKAATWRDTSIQTLVKRITQAQGRPGNPVELTVKMTQSWRLSYIGTKNFDDDKGPVFLLTEEPITDNLDLHKVIAAHIRKLKIRVNYQQLINVDKIIGCDWCKNQNHPSHACPFLGVDSTRYGPSTDELRLRMMKTETLKDAFRKQKEDSTKPGGSSKRGKHNDDGWNVVRHGKKQ